MRKGDIAMLMTKTSLALIVCAAFVGGFLERCGAAVELREIHPGRPNVIAVSAFRGKFGRQMLRLSSSDLEPKRLSSRRTMR